MVASSSRQYLDSSYQVIEGTEVTGFTPVLGTTKLLYKVSIAFDFAGSNPLANFIIEVKEEGLGSWTEILKSTETIYGDHVCSPFECSAVLHLGDNSNDLSNGRTSTSRPTLSFRVRAREYQNNSTYNASVNNVDYVFDGDDSILHVDRPVPPRVDIISLGPETQPLTYERTA